MSYTKETAAEAIKGLIDIQKQHGNYNCDEYMYGMLVGLECAYYTILEQWEFEYTPRPERFLNSIRKKKKKFKAEVTYGSGENVKSEYVYNKGNKRTS
ncbi:hypothetical protein EBU95_21550 [bacterium]|nr:hypothetical protein [bacterium]